jgi:CubicO group peptidase (beta-lactamase class C family)
MSETREAARARLADGVSGVGSQVVVATRRTTTCDVAIGEALPGRAMTRDTVQALFCLTKPLVAASVCACAEERGIGVDDDVAANSPRVARMTAGRPVTLRDVLTHTAGLHPVMGAEVMFMPRAERLQRCEQVTWAPDWRVGVDRCYSDFQGWNLLRLWLEDVTGVRFGEYIRRALLDPLGIGDVYFGVNDDEWDDVSARLGVHYEMDHGIPRPLLHELLRKHVDDPEMQSVGGYGSACAIARFYRAALDVIGGREVVGLPSPVLLREMVQPSGPPAADPLLTSVLSFGMGFMTDLRTAFGSAIGPRAFGHFGVLGGSFAFADPDRDLVVVYVANGFPYSAAHRSKVLAARAAIVDVVYSDAAVAA